MAGVIEYVKCDECGGDTDTPVTTPHFGRFYCAACMKKIGGFFRGYGDAPQPGTPWECSCAEKHSGVHGNTEAN